MVVGKELKRRIKSIRNTKKITKAMELVAASKMRRAISATLASRPYAGYSWEILQSLSDVKTESMHPLLEVRPVKKLLVILVTSNRGLCGAYNAQVIRRTIELIKGDTTLGTEISFITVGRKGDAAMRRVGQNIVASFTELPDTVTLRDIVPVANLAISMFKDKSVDRVVVAYTDFISALSQKPRVRALLPISKNDIEKVIDFPDVGRLGTESRRPTSGNTEYLFEPGYEQLMPILVEKIAKMAVYQMLLESIASEESSRMVAMKNASEAASEMIDELTLQFNKARQASITQEISEISAGMASVS